MPSAPRTPSCDPLTDVEGSTDLRTTRGDEAAHARLQTQGELVRRQLDEHGGHVVKAMGDGFMVAFQIARRALICSMDIQRAFAAYSREHPECPIRIRVGLHVGEPVHEGDDFYGKGVVVASPIAGQARGGEILVSSLLKDLVEAGGDIRFGEMRQTELKGFAQPYTVFPVDWEF